MSRQGVGIENLYDNQEEKNTDYDRVYYLIKSAFETAEHSDGNEHKLVVALRNTDAFVPELSLVAEVYGMILGHILFTKVIVGKNQDMVLSLAPLLVSPELQKQGVGSALINEGHKRAADSDYQY